jgi:hypothetical protein
VDPAYPGRCHVLDLGAAGPGPLPSDELCLEPIVGATRSWDPKRRYTKTIDHRQGGIAAGTCTSIDVRDLLRHATARDLDDVDAAHEHGPHRRR